MSILDAGSRRKYIVIIVATVVMTWVWGLVSGVGFEFISITGYVRRAPDASPTNLNPATSRSFFF